MTQAVIDLASRRADFSRETRALPAAPAEIIKFTTGRAAKRKPAPKSSPLDLWRIAPAARESGLGRYALKLHANRRFGARLKLVRTFLGASLSEAAAAAGVKWQQYSYYERSDRMRPKRLNPFLQHYRAQLGELEAWLVEDRDHAAAGAAFAAFIADNPIADAERAALVAAALAEFHANPQAFP